jgi:hypothetical protein
MVWQYAGALHRGKWNIIQSPLSSVLLNNKKRSPFYPSHGVWWYYLFMLTLWNYFSSHICFAAGDQTDREIVRSMNPPTEGVLGLAVDKVEACTDT